MKTLRFLWRTRVLLSAAFLWLAFDKEAFAQTSTSNSPLPVVTIRATDPIASWSGKTGTFTVFRAGPTNMSLNVYYDIGGTASNGVDYATISHFVLIPEGVTSNTITISPINNGQTNTETVVLKLTNSPLMIPVNYSIGSPSSATVYITPPGVTNIPPSVSFIEPTNGETFNGPTNIQLIAGATDPDGYAVSVELFANGNSLGISSNFAIIDPPGSPGVPPGSRAFFFTWSNVPPNYYTLTAKATDNGGASSFSDPIKVIVQPVPPPTNIPPVVRIISPPNGAVFHAPINIPLYAFAADPDGFVTSVQFFENGNSLGFGEPLPRPVPIGTAAGAVLPSPIILTNIYFLLWSNAPAGTHALTAIATDNGGASTTSAVVNITILPSPPPPSNQPPVVNIVATDPIAIEGTNCWPWVGLVSAAPTWSNWAAALPCRLFTNCGPKDATFTVRRHGVTNDALTVSYAIGGTATNGLDYMPLSGEVTIPAGQFSALITVVPIDDGTPDITGTVVLKLIPSTNTPPDYLLGFPRSAAAIILDPPPRPVAATVLSDKCFRLHANGPDGAWFHVEYSTDFQNWTALCTNQVVQGSIDFIDPDASNDSSRFYRAVPEPAAPAN
jgi:hypothetical protein